eukprot:2159806-Pyramimonas_sp.AAC.1
MPDQIVLQRRRSGARAATQRLSADLPRQRRRGRVQRRLRRLPRGGNCCAGNSIFWCRRRESFTGV